MNNKDIQKSHSRLGIISLGFAVVNVVIFAYIFHRITRYIMAHPELLKDPMLISGMQVEPSTSLFLSIFFAFQIFGLLLGLIGLFNSKVKKLYPVLGTALNGLFVLFTSIKLGII
jgi:hypothetical protein